MSSCELDKLISDALASERFTRPCLNVPASSVLGGESGQRVLTGSGPAWWPRRRRALPGIEGRAWRSRWPLRRAMSAGLRGAGTSPPTRSARDTVQWSRGPGFESPLRQLPDRWSEQLTGPQQSHFLRLWKQRNVWIKLCLCCPSSLPPFPEGRVLQLLVLPGEWDGTESRVCRNPDPRSRTLREKGASQPAPRGWGGVRAGGAWGGKRGASL